MKRREFLGAGVAGIATGLIRPGAALAQQNVTVAVHFIGMHCRIVDPRNGKLAHNLLSLKDKDHRPVMLLRAANVAHGDLGCNYSPDPAVVGWVLSGRYVFPTAAEAGARWENGDPTKCPRTLSDWKLMSRLNNAKNGGASPKQNWRDDTTSLGARYELNAEGTAPLMGELHGEPPLLVENRRAIWKTGGKKPILTDRFVYRVKTADPTIRGNGTVTLKLALGESSIEIYVLTSMVQMTASTAPKYKKGDKLKHSSVGQGLLTGPAPDPIYDDDCRDGEESEVENEIGKFPKWLRPVFAQNPAEVMRRCHDDRLGPRSSLDTFCPGWDGS